jgi:hypothetical protein
VPFSPSCCCCALLKTSCSLATSIDRNAISLPHVFCSTHFSVWPLVQLLGRGRRVEQSCAQYYFIHILEVFWAQERSLRKERPSLTL